MKSETSVSVVFQEVMPTIRRSTVSALFACVAFISASAQADNSVRFSGSVVNATCSIQTVGQNPASQAKQLDVAPDVTVQLDTARTACDGRTAPFIARYTPVDMPAPQASGTAKAGVITLTYP